MALTGTAWQATLYVVAVNQSIRGGVQRQNLKFLMHVHFDKASYRIYLLQIWVQDQEYGNTGNGHQDCLHWQNCLAEVLRKASGSVNACDLSLNNATFTLLRLLTATSAPLRVVQFAASLVAGCLYI